MDAEHPQPMFWDAATQFYTINPGTRANSDTLLVTTTKPWLRAWAAMCKPFTPMGAPNFSKEQRMEPWC
jgi:hypothetical protein